MGLNLPFGKLEPKVIRAVLALVVLFSLTANWTAPTREKIEADAKRILLECNAERVIEVVVDDSTNLKIVSVKKPEERTEADLRALRCVGRQSTRVIDFRPLAEYLLLMRSAE